MMDQHHMMCFHHSVKESNSMSVVRHLRESKYIKHGFGEATICGHHRLADLDDDQHGLNHPAPSADGDPCGCWNLQQLLLLNRHRRGCTTTSVANCNLQFAKRSSHCCKTPSSATATQRRMTLDTRRIICHGKPPRGSPIPDCFE